MRTSCFPKRAILVAAGLALLALALALSGCSKSETESGMSAPPPAPAPHVAASGPAVDVAVTFDQLTLETPPKLTKDKNGLEFLKFRYADNDGKVYDCVLPKPMSEGQYKLGEWLSTFNAYRIPKVVAQKKVAKREEFGDFPFISPKPRQQDASQQQPGSSPGDMQPLPAAPGVTPPPPAPPAPGQSAP